MGEKRSLLLQAKLSLAIVNPVGLLCRLFKRTRLVMLQQPSRRRRHDKFFFIGELKQLDLPVVVDYTPGRNITPRRS